MSEFPPNDLERLTQLLRAARAVADGLTDLDDDERQQLADALARTMRRCGAPVIDVRWSTDVDLVIDPMPTKATA